MNKLNKQKCIKLLNKNNYSIYSPIYKNSNNGKATKTFNKKQHKTRTKSFRQL